MLGQKRITLVCGELLARICGMAYEFKCACDDPFGQD